MTTQAIRFADLPAGAVWGPVAVLLALGALAAVILVDRYYLEPRRDATLPLGVYSVASARRAMHRVDRMDPESGPDQAAALRNLQQVATWAQNAGDRRARDLGADARAGLEGFGWNPDTMTPMDCSTDRKSAGGTLAGTLGPDRRKAA